MKSQVRGGDDDKLCFFVSLAERQKPWKSFVKKKSLVVDINGLDLMNLDVLKKCL